MATANTHGDSIRWKHTGAGSHNDAQTDPDLSLGNHLSSSEATSIASSVASDTLDADGVTVARISASNGDGSGVLTCTASNTYTWTAPGGSAGPAVVSAAGVDVVCEDGSDPNKFIVFQTDAPGPNTTGALTLTLTIKQATVFGFDAVPSSEQATGKSEYRTVGFEVMNPNGITVCKVKVDKLGTQAVTSVAQLGASGSGTIQGAANAFTDWPTTGWAVVKTNAPAVKEIVYYSSRTSDTLTIDTSGRALYGSSATAGVGTDTVDAVSGCAVAIDAPASQNAGAFAISSGENSAPSPAQTFSFPLETSEFLSIGDLTVNQIYAIHLWREVPAGATAAINSDVKFRLKYDAG